MIDADSFDWNEGFRNCDDLAGHWLTTDAISIESSERNERTLIQTANVDAMMRRLHPSKYRRDEYGSLYVKPWELTQDELEMLAAIEEYGVLDEEVYAAVQAEWEEDEVRRWVAAVTAQKCGLDYLDMDWKQTECFERAVLKSLRDYSHWESSGFYVDTDNADYQALVRKNTHEMWRGTYDE